MKKIILSILAVCAMAITGASAQEFSFGVKAGMNITTIGGDISDDFDMSSRIGYTVGVMAEYAFSEKSAVGVELLYSLQGCKDDTFRDEWGLNDKLYLNFSYLNIPILYSYNIAGGLAIKAGIQPGFLLSSKVKYDGESEDFEDVYGADVNSFSFAIPVGVSYTFAEKVVIDARYNIACSNVVDADDYSSKNGAFQLTVGYKF